MSMGLLLEADSPAVLRGPMVTRYTQQFLRNAAWGNLDVLLPDLPPATGDIQQTIVQTIPPAGAVIVTTPQEVAFIDASKVVAMFRKTNVPILGIIENMAYFIAPADGSRHEIFGNGRGESEALKLGVPLDPTIRIASDAGTLLALTYPENEAAKIIAVPASTLAATLK